VDWKEEGMERLIEILTQADDFKKRFNACELQST